MRLLTIIALVLVTGVGTGPVDDPPATDPPVAVFAELDGTWEGIFVGYDEAGRELYRIRVRQTYRTLDEFTQEVEIRDEMPDGTVITGRGRNIARRGDDGDLRLTCEVSKSNGEEVVHDGRLVEGPDGDRQIIWHSRGSGRVETFRERVTEDVYEINGMGRYGQSMILMTGRYRRVATSEDRDARSE